MGMFDEYRTNPPLQCPICHVELKNWQGKDGPCALLTFEQGKPLGVPLTDQPVDPFWEGSEGLPERFELYSSDCGRHWVTAEGRRDADAWVSTSIISVRDLPALP